MNTYRVELFEPNAPAKRYDVDALRLGTAIRRVLDNVAESEIVAVHCRLSGVCVPFNSETPMVRKVPA